MIVGPEWDRREVNLDMPKDDVGIFVSGGIDSACLLHLMPSNSRNRHFHIFTIDNKRDNSIEHARDCISCAWDKYQQYGNTYTWHPVTPNDPMQVDQLIMQTAVPYRAIPIYTGANHIPPVEWFELPGSAPWRPWRLSQKKIRTPFLFLYKYHILSIIEHNDWQDIYRVAHTCTEQVAGSCGACWQCNELQWAREELINDPIPNPVRRTNE